MDYAGLTGFLSRLREHAVDMEELPVITLPQWCLRHAAAQIEGEVGGRLYADPTRDVEFNGIRLVPAERSLMADGAYRAGLQYRGQWVRREKPRQGRRRRR